MNIARSVLFTTTLTTAACTGPIPGVPPVEFRLNSPARPTNVTDNHQEIHQESHTTNVQVQQSIEQTEQPAEQRQQPSVVLYPYPVLVAAPPVSPTLPPSAPLTNGNAAPTNPSSGTPLIAMALAESALDRVAATDAAVMAPYTSAFGGQFAEGQAMELPFSVPAGRCYSIIGTGFGVRDIELELVISSPYPMGVVARRSGEQPIIGDRGSGCMRMPWAAESVGKIVIRANHGAGLAFAKVYVD